MTETNQDLCSICLRPRQKSSSGSLTQWINYCRCASTSSEDAPEETVVMCKVCTKRINEGRSGSLTQWIFSEHICKCEVPQPMSVASSKLQTNRPAVNNIKDDRTVESDEEEIEVDETLFPTSRYRPLKFLGQGALGQVYLCRDLHLSKRVAVKSLMGLTDDRVVSFQQEAKTVSKLNHENIIKVFDFGTASSGRPYMVMEYFEGQSFQEVLAQKGRLNEYEARVIFSAVCEALCHLHENKIFHRDLKPSNILIAENDSGMISVRLIDFGLSKTTQDVQSRTLVQGRTVVGTPLYMSPDQVSGLEYDARSEIYSFGCVMYEALSGELPFTGDTSLEILNKHMTASLPSLKVLAPDLSDEICAIATKCLNKSPEQRFQSVREILEEIGDTKNLWAADAVSPASKTDDSQTKQRNDSILGLNARLLLFASFVALICVGTTVYYILSRTGKDEVRRPIRASFDAIEGLDPHNVLSEQDNEARRQLERALHSNMSRLELGHVCKDDDLKVLQGKASIESIDLVESRVTDKAFQYLAKIPNLTELDLTRTYVTDLRGLNQLKSLRVLSLNTTSIDDSALDNVIKIKPLTHLNLSHTKITDRGVEKLTALPHLEILKIDHNARVGTASIKVLKHMKTLREVDLTETQITQSEIEDLARTNRSLSMISFFGTEREYGNMESKFPTIIFSRDRQSQVIRWQQEAAAKMAKKNFADSLPLWQKIIAAEDNSNKPFSESYCLAQMSVCYYELKKFEMAEKTQRRILQIASEQNDEVLKLYALKSLFSFYATQSDNEKTEMMAQQMLRQSEKVYGRPSKKDAENKFDHLSWYAGSQQIDKCYRATKQLLKDYKLLYGGSDVFTATATVVEAKCLEQLKRGKESIAKYEEARKLYARFDPAKLTDVQLAQHADLYNRLIRLRLERNEYESALEIADEALRTVPKFSRSVRSQLQKKRITILEKLGRKEEAE